MKLGILRSMGLGLCALVGFGVTANADPVTYAGGSGLGNANSGGEFKFFIPTSSSGLSTVIGSSTSGGKYAFTFCLELQEHISQGTTYDATLSGTSAVGGRAYAGGLGTTGTDINGIYDEISLRTAYIFRTFETNRNYTGESTITGTGTGPWGYASTTYSDVDLANATQLAIWASEDELTYAGLTAYGSIGSLAQALYNAGNVYAGRSTSTFQDVRVMNLTTSAGVLAQSQLVRATSNIDLPPTPLPGVAVAGLACFSGLGGLQIVRRRRRMA